MKQTLVIGNTGISFIQTHPPPRTNRRNTTSMEQNPPPETIIVYKIPPLGTEQGVKSPMSGT